MIQINKEYYLIRNAIDHGLETQKERIQNNKPPRGLLMLSAEKENDVLLIKCEDDGKGIDTDRIKEKALSQGLVDPAALASNRLKTRVRPWFSYSAKLISIFLISSSARSRTLGFS